MAGRLDLGFPFRLDGAGRTETVDYERHVRDLIEQVLFTAPGERVNRPDFGTGLLQAVFRPNTAQLVGTLQADLHRWLGSIIAVDGVEVVPEDASLSVTVRYTILQTGQKRIDRFAR